MSPSFRVEVERTEFHTYIVTAPTKDIADKWGHACAAEDAGRDAGMPPDVRVIEVEEDGDEVGVTVTEFCEDDQHRFEELPGEPPVDVCSQCGKERR